MLRTLARCHALCPEMSSEFALCFDGRIAAELARAGATVHILGGVRARNPIKVAKARRWLVRIATAGAFDAIICHMLWPLAIFGPAVRRLNLPLIFWMHDAVMHTDWLTLWAQLSPPDLVICNSRFTASTLRRLFIGMPFKTLYYPVERSRKATDSARRDLLRSQLKTSSDAIVLIQASRMERWKGHSLLLDALAHLRNLPGWVCWIAGGPQRSEEIAYSKRLRSRAVDLGLQQRVSFLGLRSDVPELLAAADIYCQPNIEPEPFGIVFIEALQASLPIVTSAGGGALEIVDESCGALVPFNDPASLAMQLETLVTNDTLRHRLGAAGVRRAAQLCEPRRQLQQLHALIQNTPVAQPPRQVPLYEAYLTRHLD